MGEDPLKLKENMGRILDTGSRAVIIRKRNGTEVRGRMVNWDTAEFNLDHMEEGHSEPGFSLHPDEVYRSYLA